MPSLGNLPGVFLCLDGAQSISVCAHCLLSHHWTPLRSPWLLLYSLPSSIYYTLMGCNLSLLQTGQSHLSHSLFTGLWLMGKNWFFRGLIFFYFLMLVLLSFVLDEIFLINLGQIKNISFGLRDWLETIFLKFNTVYIYRESRGEEQGKIGADLYPLGLWKLGHTALA